MAELKGFFEELQEGVGTILKKCGQMISGSAESDLRHLLADLDALKEKLPPMFLKKKSEKIVAAVELLSKKLDKINKDEGLKRTAGVKEILTYMNSAWNKLLGEIIKMIPKMERKAKADRIIIRLERLMRE